MTPAKARRLLGLARDADARAVRRAYADALRAFDVDLDPEGFAELRAARDVALAEARARADAAAGDALPLRVSPAEAGAQLGDSDGDARAPSSPTSRLDPSLRRGTEEDGEGRASSGESDDDGPDPAPVFVTIPPPPDPTEEAARREIDDHASALLAILAPGDVEAEPYLTPDEEAAAHAHLDVLLADPRLDRIDLRVSAEQWYADLIGEAGSRADPLLPRLVPFFGWQRDRGRIDQAPAIAAAVHRYDELVFVTAVATRGHRHHTAWNVLTGASPGWRNLFVRQKRVRALIAEVRRDHPGMEAWFDPQRLDRWEHGSIGTWRTVMLAIWCLVLVARCLPDPPPPAPGGGVPVATFPSDFAAPATGTGLTSPEADVEPMLKLAGGEALTLAALDAANPGWHRALIARWQRAKDLDADRPSFMKGVLDEVEDRYAAALRTADYRLVSWARQLRLDELILARDRLGTLQCGDILNGADMPRLVADHYREQRRQLVRDVLLAMEGIPERPRRPGGTFVIPGTVYAAAAKRAGMTPDAFGRAIDRKAGETDACNAWIALHQTALAQPARTGLKLLREM